MKKFILLFLFGSVSLFLSAQTINYPSYSDVLNNFFSKYSKYQITEECNFSFYKKPDGWHVAMHDTKENENIDKEELFWDRKTNKYQKLSFKKLEGDFVDFSEIEAYLNDFSSTYFQICPYYGYSGWDWDVIKDYKDKSNLSDSTLYGLGRAYSSFASNLLNSNSGLSDTNKQFKLANQPNCMSAEQLSTYRYYRHLAIDKFEELALRNPNFETIVGKIGIKASNEHLTSYLDLLIYQNKEEANKELKPNLYNDFYISTAKNYLNSCATNAILFTNGDNDTYPLLYVQNQLGFRQDVVVVNLSLLMTDRYINSFRETKLSAPKLPLSFSPNQIEGNNRNLIVILSLDQEPIEVSDLLDFIKNDSNTKDLGGLNYYYSPTNSFQISTDNSEIQWTIDENYFYRNDLILLDIMAQNKWNKPLYFATSVGDFFGLKNFLKSEGLALRITTESEEPAENQYFNINSEQAYKNMMSAFEWNGMEDKQNFDMYFGLNYRIIFSTLAVQLIKENKTDSALNVLNKSLSLFNNERLAFDNSMFVPLDCYYQLKENNTANAIAKQMIQNLKKQYLNPTIFNDLEYLESVNRNLEMLKQLAIQYNQQEILDEIEKLMKGNE